MHRKRIFRFIGGVAIVVAFVGLGIAALVTRDRWLPWIGSNDTTAKVDEDQAPIEDAKVLKLSPQARKNLGLVSKAVAIQTYWRTVQLPGVVVDRPGLSDRGVLVKWEQPIYKDWLLGEVAAGHFWLRPDAQSPRGRAFRPRRQ